MSRLVTCMGEILIDFLPIEERGRTTGFKMHAGGSPFNVAVGLARLGRPVAFASKLSSDLFGRYLRDHVEAEGIDTRFLPWGNEPSTLAFVAMEGGEPAYAFYGEGTADAMLSVEDIPEALYDETCLLHVGSISLLRGTTPSVVLATVERLKGKALLSFDPNVRPGMVTAEAQYRTLLDRLFVLADIVKISASDLDWLAPGTPVDEAAQDLLSRGPALVAVTRGGNGVLALRHSERWDVPGFEVALADTVGAGDAFSAGLLASLVERDVTSRGLLESLPGEEIALSLRFAAAVSALTCTRPGADPPTRGQVMAFIAATNDGQRTTDD